MEKIDGLTLGKLIQNLLSMFLLLAGVAIFGSILWSGYLFITSQGEPDKIQTARKSLTYSMIGLLVIAFTYVIMIYFIKLV